MNKCIKCGSYAFNLIDQGGLCDVHYWQDRAHRAEALAQPEQKPVAFICQGNVYMADDVDEYCTATHIPLYTKEQL